jgi:hypothetical protein
VFKSPENINHADQILPEVCGTTLRRLVVAKPYTSFPFWKKNNFSDVNFSDFILVKYIANLTSENKKNCL